MIIKKLAKAVLKKDFPPKLQSRDSKKCLYFLGRGAFYKYREAKPHQNRNTPRLISQHPYHVTHQISHRDPVSKPVPDSTQPITRIVQSPMLTHATGPDRPPTDLPSQDAFRPRHRSGSAASPLSCGRRRHRQPSSQQARMRGAQQLRQPRRRLRVLLRSWRRP